MSSQAAKATKNRNSAAVAAVNSRLRNRAGSTDGAAVPGDADPGHRGGHGRGRERADRGGTPPAPGGPLDRGQVSKVIAASRARADSQSGRRVPRWARTSGRIRSPATMVATPMGTLTRKIHRQLNPTSSPPTGAPEEAATAATPAHTPTAAVCWRAGKDGSSSPSEAGTMTAAPAACSTRPAISTPRTGATAHSTDAAVKMATPASRKPAPAEVVGQPSGRDQERGEHDRVGVQHPGQAGQPRPARDEGPAHRRDRDVDDEQVELGHEGHRREHGQDPPRRGCPCSAGGQSGRARTDGVATRAAGTSRVSSQAGMSAAPGCKFGE